MLLRVTVEGPCSETYDWIAVFCRMYTIPSTCQRPHTFTTTHSYTKENFNP